MTKAIHISWDGPYTFNEVEELDDKIDKGVYQIYGVHPVYGVKVLLYIGQTAEQTFSRRLLSQKKEWEEENFEQLQIYVGRLWGEITPDKEEWSNQIDMAEKLLICSHAPAYNLNRKEFAKDKEIGQVHIYNWDEYNMLLPEVSGGRWTYNFIDTDKSGYYGSHNE